MHSWLFLLSLAWSSSWKVKLARMEGAATDVKAAATSLQKISKDIQEKQRLYRIAELSVAAQHLEQQIQSAKLALQQVQPKQIQ